MEECVRIVSDNNIFLLFQERRKPSTGRDEADRNKSPKAYKAKQRTMGYVRGYLFRETMKFDQLRLKAKQTGLFSLEDVFKWFSEANRQTVKNQLSHWTAKNYLLRLKKNLYFIQETELKDEFILANQLYQPSYVSLESALNYYGIIPDVLFNVTSVSSRKTQEFKNKFGLFLYRSLRSELFFGWQEVKVDKHQFYKIAKPEKALFDFLYLNKNSLGKNFPQEERFIFGKDFDWREFKRYALLAKSKKFQELVSRLK